MPLYEAIVYLAGCAGLLFISQLSPGPDFILVVRAALHRGWRAGAWLGFGIGAGGLIHTTLFCLWGTWLVTQSWSFYIILAASLWLMYLAYKILRSALDAKKNMTDLSVLSETSTQEKDLPILQLFTQGFVCNLLNAKFVLFIASIGIYGMEQYATSLPWYSVAFILTIGIVNSLGWVLWSRLFQWSPLRTFYKRHEPTIDTFFAILLFALSIYIIFN